MTTVDDDSQEAGSQLLRSLGPSPIRAALIAGLMALFVLWLGTGYEIVRNLSEAQRRVSDVHTALINGEETLSSIRTSVLLGSIYLRDALIDSSDKRSYYRDELRTFRANIEARLSALSSTAELPVERTEWRQLEEALNKYWETLDLFLGPDAPATFVQGTGVLRRQVVPARTTVLEIVDRLADLQRLAQRERQADASALYARVTARIGIIAIATMAIGGFVAWLVVRRVAGLERELQRRRLIESRQKRDLQRLSARLVDAQEQERRALARELHDEFGQALTALKMEVGVALNASGGSPSVRHPLEQARSIADNTLHGIRDLSQFLHPSTLDDFGLPATVTSYVRKFEKRSAIHVDVTLTGLEARLPAGVEVAVYRIVQEALTNVARHSNAREATVAVTRAGDYLEVVIEDDGVGVSTPGEAGATRGLGVIGMRERAQSLSGSLSIQPRLGGGTRVVVRTPIAPQFRNANDLFSSRVPA